MELHFYLNFKDETGEIWKLTNELDVSTPYIEISRETMLDFANEVKKMDDYMVIPSSDKTLKYEIVLKHKDLDIFDVDKSVHHLPKVTSVDTNNAFIIKQNLESATWTISLTSELRELLSSTMYYKDKNQYIYVTQKDNPTVLLDTLDIKMYNVLYSESFNMTEQNKKVAQNPDVSLYCGKVFENYLHIQETV
jgi:hypothetical protein|tara:strand:- start:1040 stop:1618 length:579 start_codon:yes stop_codon:yes gene_type:complete